MVSHPRIFCLMRPSAVLCLFFFSLPGLSAQQPGEKPDAAPGAPSPAVDGARQLAEARQKLRKVSATEYDLDGIHINASTREVRFPAQVCLKKAPIEYMLTTDTGKTHETVLTTTIQPTAIQVALLLASYEAATEGLLKDVPEDEKPKIWKEEPPRTPGGNRVKIDIEWKARGQVRKTPLKLMVQNVDTRKPPPDLDTWVFNGSYIDERGFIAQHEGSIIAVWLDRGAIINSAAKGNWRDDLWISMPDNIPDEATPVTVIITPAQP
jgi:hypothetical protein